ncbi:PREDICTED: somatostatin-2-like [Gekko japonicus]|uniref:Somatostatin-2-like n=1 Tax=Gekko japonicus TaxID=146911 RepID=A0ABM1KED8_GEKJA|nr:PREDICTED: somatostatin-2-like [Gekko japonicus]
MQLVASLLAVLLLVWSVRASALPGEDKLSAQSSREQFKARKGLILKMLADLLDEVDTYHETTASLDPDDPLASELEEEHSILEQLSQTTQRDRKAPCKNFFWKTFTAC